MRYIRRGILEFINYYEIKHDHVMRLNYIRDYKFLVRIFDLAGNEISYLKPSSDTFNAPVETLMIKVHFTSQQRKP